MPGFIGHTAANAVVLIGTSAVMRWQGWSWGDVIAVDAGIAAASFLLSPDMDLFNSRSMKDWGYLRFLWYPYAKLVKHRDRLHLPVIGTTVRWLYVVGLMLAVYAVLFQFVFKSVVLGINGDTADTIYNLLYLADVFLGAVIADATHYVLDMTTTRLKRQLAATH